MSAAQRAEECADPARAAEWAHDRVVRLTEELAEAHAARAEAVCRAIDDAHVPQGALAEVLGVTRETIRKITAQGRARAAV